MGGARDALGSEHFPRCRCFAEGDGEMHEVMYGLADAMSRMVHMNATLNGLCPSTAPYLVALVAHMMTARFAADLAAQETPDDATEPVPGLFNTKLREIHPALIERLNALMARSERIALAGPGTGSVQ